MEFEVQTISEASYCLAPDVISWASQVVKNPLANARDTRDVPLIPGSGGSPGEGNGNPLQYSCLDNPTDKEA